MFFREKLADGEQLPALDIGLNGNVFDGHTIHRITATATTRH